MDGTAVLLTLQDMAARYNLTPAAIYQARYRGEFPPAVRVGKRLRWRLDDVEAWEAAHRDSGGGGRAA